MVPSIGSPYAGLTISKYQPENSSQNSLYTIMRASDMRYSANAASTCRSMASSLDENHSTAHAELSGWGRRQLRPTFNQTECIPHLAAEIATLFYQCFVEDEVVTGRRA